MSFTLNNLKKYGAKYNYGIQVNAQGTMILKQAKIFEIKKIRRESHVVAEGILEGTLPTYQWRENRYVVELQTMVNGVHISTAYEWKIHDVDELAPLTLHQELRLHPECKTLPSIAYRPTGQFSPGYPTGLGGLRASAEVQLLEGVAILLQIHGKGELIYPSLIPPAKTVEDRQKEAERDDYCRHCLMGPCLWDRAEVDVKNQVEWLIATKPTRKQNPNNKRHLAYRHFAFIIHGGPGGPRIDLPTCVKKEIRAYWPSPNGDYTDYDHLVETDNLAEMNVGAVIDLSHDDEEERPVLTQQEQEAALDM
jgi:hypothetical protein